MNKIPKYFILFVLLTSVLNSRACECPLSSLGMEECNKYEIIFKGKVISVVTCKDKFGEAIFEVQELYKGNAEKQFKVLFECNKECFYLFQPGEEWIIYSKYKQINNALMDYCSRSRRYFKNDKEDYYSSTYGNDYHEELKFLREKLGLHRLLVKKEGDQTGRNQLPTNNQSVFILFISVACIVLFYFLFTRFFK